MRNQAPMGEKDKGLNLEIGKRVQAARENHGITRNHLAKLIGLSDGTALYKYERGDRGFSNGQLIKLSEHLGVSTDWLLWGAEHGHKPKTQKASSAGVPPVLPSLGIRLTSEPALPKPILDLINLGWVANITNDDIYRLRIHLETGGSAEPLDLLVVVYAQRLAVDGSEDNLRVLNEANRRRAEALGGKRLQEPEKPPQVASKKAVNQDMTSSSPKRRRRTRTDSSD